MKNKHILAVYQINMMIQAVFDLLCPIGLCTLAAWYFVTKRAAVGEWLYAVLILLGVFIGIWSMISFILKATAQIRALEAQEKEKGDRP
ncbi:MAG: AtpZ/AtpI family protein [Clostridia bacterium]|nr:AtpZ/AtpI family protein [Clostridia bacterium]